MSVHIWSLPDGVGGKAPLCCRIYQCCDHVMLRSLAAAAAPLCGEHGSTSLLFSSHCLLADARLQRPSLRLAECEGYIHSACIDISPAPHTYTRARAGVGYPHGTSLSRTHTHTLETCRLHVLLLPHLCNAPFQAKLSGYGG